MITQPTFLYIEDHPASRRVMTLMLQEVMGYEVTILDNSANVMNQLEANQPDFSVIFLDLNVEPIGGIDLVPQLKAHPRCAATRIIALTASISPADMKNVRAAGFDGLIGKPISPTRFPNQIARLLAGESIWEVD
jgi:two-component system, cell cycle response regulator DivK